MKCIDPMLGIEKGACCTITEFLNTLLSHEFVLYTKTLNFHWNIIGLDFKPVHAFFQDQYTQLFDIVDDVAERVRKLGHVSFGSMKEFLAKSAIKEHEGALMNSTQMMTLLLADHETIIRAIRPKVQEFAKLGDEATANFFADLLERHEKMAWMLRASLEK